MDFSAPFSIYADSIANETDMACYSADGEFLAIVSSGSTAKDGGGRGPRRPAAAVVATVIKVFQAASLQLLARLRCQGVCSRLYWAPSAPLLMSLTKRKKTPGAGPLLELWDAEQPTSFYRALEVGPGGARHVEWAPDSRHVLVNACFGLQTSIWSFADGSVRFLESPKWADGGQGLRFSRSGDRLAALERRHGRDFCCIVGCPATPTEEWQLHIRFALDEYDVVGGGPPPSGATAAGGRQQLGGVFDTADLAWAPDDSMVATRDSDMDFGVSVWDVHAGRQLGAVQLPFEETGGLGVRCWSWAPDQLVLATGTYDGLIRLFAASLEHGLSPVLVQPHPQAVPAGSFICYLERGAPAELGDEFLELPPVRPTRYELAVANETCRGGGDGGGSGSSGKYLCRLAAGRRPRPDDPQPQAGVRWLSFSPCGRWLASLCDDQPNALFIWDLQDSRSNGCVLEHLRPVLAAAWCPGRMGNAARLCCVCAESPTLYLWTPAGAAAVALPVTHADDQVRASRGQPHFSPRSLVWRPNGRSLLMFGSSPRVARSTVVVCEIVDNL